MPTVDTTWRLFGFYSKQLKDDLKIIKVDTKDANVDEPLGADDLEDSIKG